MLFRKQHVQQALLQTQQRVHAMLVMLVMVSFVVHARPIHGVLGVYPMDALNMLPLQYSHPARTNVSATLVTLEMAHLRAPPPVHCALLVLTVEVATRIFQWLVLRTPYLHLALHF